MGIAFDAGFVFEPLPTRHCTVLAWQPARRSSSAKPQGFECLAASLELVALAAVVWLGVLPGTPAGRAKAVQEHNPKAGRRPTAQLRLSPNAKEMLLVQMLYPPDRSRAEADCLVTV